MPRTVLLVIALALVAPVSGLGAPPQVAEPVPAAGAEGMSSAAITAAPAVVAAIAALGRDLDRAIRSPGWRNDEWGVLVVSLDHGDTLYARNPDASLVPASNLKLFTSAAALYYLGPDHRYNTFLLTEGRVEDGVLHGDLVVYGTGDPTLSSRTADAWAAFADALGALGVREVAGNVVGDVSYFSGSGAGVGWRDRYMNASYAATASALTIDENLVTIQVRPAEYPGWRPEIRVVPGGNGIAVVNHAITVPGGPARIHVERAGYDGPIVVTGELPVGHAGLSRVVPVSDAGRLTAAVLRQALEEREIRVAGGVREVSDPDASVLSRRTTFAPAFDEGPPVRLLAVHQSPPLGEILEVVNRRSHNLYAEQVLRTVGRVVLGEGSAQAGALATRYFLECETGVTDLALEMLDGSGLSPLNRTSAGTLTLLLAHMAQTPVWDAFWHTLPEAGRQDGLRRMYRTTAQGNLRAKTGTIDRVSSLSGYVQARNGERLAFAIVSNQVPSTWRAKRVEDDIGSRLAAFVRPAVPLEAERPVLAGGGEPVPAAALPTAEGTLVETTNGGAAGDAPYLAAAGGHADEARTRTLHVVRPGDTLAGIARSHGTTVAALTDANPGVDPRRLMPGQSLRLP